MGYLNSYKKSYLKICFSRQYQPLNVAEIELSVLTRQGLTGRVGSREEFEQQVSAWVEPRNDKGPNVDWQFTAVDARIKLKRLYP